MKIKSESKKEKIAVYKNSLYSSVSRVKLLVDRPIWRCGRRRVDLTRVFDMLVGGRGPADLHCSSMPHNDM